MRNALLFSLFATLVCLCRCGPTDPEPADAGPDAEACTIRPDADVEPCHYRTVVSDPSRVAPPQK
jgi:hypothetical protein